MGTFSNAQKTNTETSNKTVKTITLRKNPFEIKNQYNTKHAAVTTMESLDFVNIIVAHISTAGRRLTALLPLFMYLYSQITTPTAQVWPRAFG